MMAGNTVARNVVATLAGNVLQLAAFLRRYCSNALDLAAFLRRYCSNALDLVALLRWPATRCCYDNVLDLATLLRWPATRWTSQRCCDVRQRAKTPAFLFLFFFYTRQLEERKKMGEREKF
jgi:hypothetical protein